MPDTAFTLDEDSLGVGNIDLARRPIVRNPDGSISTVRSMSFEENGREILIPTVSEDGRILSPDEAIDRYHKTGSNLGTFRTPEAATRAAKEIHDEQDKRYSGRSLLDAPVPRDPSYEYGNILPYRRKIEPGLEGSVMRSPAEFSPLYSNLVAGAVDAFTAPRRAATGNIRNPEEEALNVAMYSLGGGAVAPASKPGELGINLYHGSRHRFEPKAEEAPHGEFDPTKIGQGEGFQAFGHGHYLAQNPKVAESYRVAGLDKQSNYFLGDKNIDELGLSDNARYWVQDYILQIGREKTPERKARAMSDRREDLMKRIDQLTDEFTKIDRAIRSKSFKDLQERHPNLGEDPLIQQHRFLSERIKDYHQALSVTEGIDPYLLRREPIKGHLYVADMNDELIPHFLDFDKGYQEQSPQVQKAMAAITKAIDPKADPKNFMIGHEFYDYVVGHTPGRNPAKATALLREHGILGNRFLDQSSRRTPDLIKDAKEELAYNKKLLGIFDKYGDEVASKDIPMTGGLTRKQIEAKIEFEEQTIKDLEKKNLTHNYVVYPGEEKKVKIVERKDD